MMHELFRRLAQFGGEGSLYVLFVMSVITMAVILERAWTILRSHSDAAKLADGLTAALRSGDLSVAYSLVESTQKSLKRIAEAGLTEASTEMPTVRDALHTATARELERLKRKLPLLPELAKFAVLIGLAGTLLDLLSLSTPIGVQVLSGGVKSVSPTHLVITTLAPAVAGLFVSIPAWLATSLFNGYVQRFQRDAESLSRTLAKELSNFGPDPASARRPSTQAA